MNLKDLEERIRDAWSRGTSVDPNGWDPGNPAWGQCAVTALVVQDFLGGVVIRGVRKNGESHYWNRLPQCDIDLTREQFPEGTEFSDVESVTVRDLLNDPSTSERYVRLADRAGSMGAR